jgi:hypothetical protein
MPVGSAVDPHKNLLLKALAAVSNGFCRHYCVHIRRLHGNIYRSESRPWTMKGIFVIIVGLLSSGQVDDLE